MIEFKRNPEDQIKILDELCESISIVYKPTGTESFFQIFKGKYYFNPKYKLNKNLYKKYTDGFWNLFVEESESISIKNETEFYPLFKTIQEATKIEEKKIPFSMFEPNLSKIIVEE
ncbi:hypothetical protein ULMS_16320 [Patiriisocius marinistellae]|uniref:Uncharacterized protein n=1 Tax=Patiriisocius marinistellae TaxID=2494560 RepID=A0A5J4FY67_9FLAO|nr:hypothetical protein [Patiriisocius marinistellae]GEQ86124.1 hypothetical protein ULMS_16320 [Patiriisocius marinistellae]